MMSMSVCDVEQLARLVCIGDETEVNEALKTIDNIADVVTGITRSGDTPLHLVAARHKLDILQTLLRLRVDVNAWNNAFETPLSVALCRNNIANAKLLLNYGARVNIVINRKKKVTILHKVALSDRYEAVQLLLENGANLNCLDWKGRTPLHLALVKKNSTTANILIKYNADVNIKDSNDWNSLFYALIYNNDDLAKILLNLKVNCAVCDKNGLLPLHIAAQNNYCEIVDMILKLIPSQINAKDITMGYTALHYACLNNNTGIVSVLLRHNADINLSTRFRKSPLHIAVSSNAHEATMLLLANKANVNVLANGNKTPLHCALGIDNSQICHCLLQSGANVNSKNINGETGLHMTAKHGQSECLYLLLGYKPIVDIRNNESATALHLAVENGNVSNVVLLLKAGANPSLRDSMGRLPIDMDTDGRIHSILCKNWTNDS